MNTCASHLYLEFKKCRHKHSGKEDSVAETSCPNPKVWERHGSGGKTNTRNNPHKLRE